MKRLFLPPLHLQSGRTSEATKERTNNLLKRFCVPKYEKNIQLKRAFPIPGSSPDSAD